MAAIKRDAADLLGGDTSKKIKIVTSEQEEDAGTMYIIQNTDELEQEEGITLEGEDSSQYITTEDSNLQIATSGAVQIVTSDGETEKHYITADGQILSSADDISSELITAEDESHLVINDDGQQVMLEESVQPLEINNEDHLGGLHEVSLEQEAVTELEDQGDKVKVVHKTGSGLLSRVVGDREELVDQYQNLIIQHMDISEPLSTLRKLLEQRLGTTLAQHEFYLQDVIPLEPSKNLTSQCVQGSGMVQINVEVKSQPGLKPRLNIVDILKPAEEVVEMQQQAAPPPPVPATKKVVIPFPEESENVTRWIVDQNFRREQERLKIPFDPVQWNEAHVRHWIQWAVAEFALSHVDIDNFVMNGRQLCELRHEDFVRYIPSDKGDIFWTHLELLRKCKFVATIQQPTPHAITTITVSSTDPHFAGKIKQYTQAKAKPRTVSVPHTQRITSGNRTGNNGQIQLWQFLLELLTDKDYMEIIHWVADDGEFKLNNPEVVAQLWGQRKNKPTMNYEKLSRALRYYYDGDMIAKVHGKRFVYKFVCDLRNLLGYSAAELKRQVTECAEKNLINVHEMSTHRRVVHHQPQRPIILHTK